jgi:hypothetical protein
MLLFQELPYLVDRGSRPNQKEKANFDYLRLLNYRFGFFRRRVAKAVYASAPVRSQPDRAYTPLDASPTPEGTHIPYFLAKLKRHQPREWDRIKAQLESFGSLSGMFQHINVKNLGRSDSDPFQIYLDFGGPQRNIMDVGYGVSQVLPVVTEVLSRDQPTVFLFQQPEVHLHPQAQAALGSFLATEVSRHKHTFLLESHSDFIIDRARTAVRSGALKPSDITLLYFKRQRLESTIFQIEVDGLGNVLNAPPDYRRFFLEEELRSLG